MFKAIISFSLRQRVLVLLAACVLVVYGTLVASTMPIDLLPETRPTSVIVTVEAGTLASEDVEQLVVQPIEAVMNGVPGVEAVRTGSNNGIAYIQVQFSWGYDVFRARQLINERLLMVREQLPPGIEPAMAPMGAATSLVMILGITGGESPMQTREWIDWVVRLRVLATEGVSNVFVVGGESRTYRFTPDPVLMEHMGITLSDVERTLTAFASNSSGGFTEVSGTEYTVRNIGRTTNLDDMRELVIAYRDSVPVLLSQVGEVSYAPRIKRGDGALNGEPSINLAIVKQPSANTVAVTQRVAATLAELRKDAPPGVQYDIAYNQGDMIQEAVSNVGHLLRDAIVIVSVVLFLFLATVRPTIISLLAIPMSLVVTALVFNYLGLTINTITLGGISTALGELVDDSVVNVENILRRLGQNKKLARPEPATRVIGRAGQEVLSGILYARGVILIVFIPLLAMPGQPGRMFKPLVLAYVTSVAASLVVSLTVTPALSSYLLPGMKSLNQEHGGWFARWLRRHNAVALAWVLDRPRTVLGLAAVAVVIAMSSVPFIPKSFLPQFNEGNVYVTMLSRPDVSLTESLRVGHMAEEMIKQLPEVISIARRGGRFEGDSDVDPVNDEEMAVRIRLDQGRSLKELQNEIRRRLSVFNVDLEVTQFLRSRMESQDNGVRGEVVLKITGPELPMLRTLADNFQDQMSHIRGIADLVVEQQTYSPQARIAVDYARARLFGITPAQITDVLSGLSGGSIVSQVVENGRRFEVVIRLADADRTPDALQHLRIDTPSGAIPLASFATITETFGPSRIMRENGVRRIAVMANLNGLETTDAVVQQVRDIVATVSLPNGYHVSLDGDFKLGEQGRAMLGILGPLAVLLIFIILQQRFRSTVLSLVVMGNIPLALVGSVAAVWISGLDLNLPVIVGFIAVTGVATRNSLLKVSHFINLHLNEQMELGRALVLRGSSERLMPVLMTAMAAGSALIPLLFASDVAGAEILHPVAVAIFGGLISSTLLDTFTTPTLFEQFGIRAMDRMIEAHAKLAYEAF